MRQVPLKFDQSQSVFILPKNRSEISHFIFRIGFAAVRIQSLPESEYQSYNVYIYDYY